MRYYFWRLCESLCKKKKCPFAIYLRFMYLTERANYHCSLPWYVSHTEWFLLFTNLNFWKMCQIFFCLCGSSSSQYVHLNIKFINLTRHHVFNKKQHKTIQKSFVFHPLLFLFDITAQLNWLFVKKMGHYLYLSDAKRLSSFVMSEWLNKVNTAFGFLDIHVKMY